MLLIYIAIKTTLTNWFQDGQGSHHITDIAWFQDQLFLVTNASSLYWYNLTSHSSGRLSSVDTVASIAVDWIGRKLYWSNLKQQLITRGNLNGSHQEPLPILTNAKELNIDAVHGFIYWSTGNSVEASRLNGKQRTTYYPAELFSGKQVMGLTLDMGSKSVYWIVRNYEGPTLFRAATLAHHMDPDQVIQPEKLAVLQYPEMQGSLCYFDDHLVWLRDERQAVVGDLSGRNSAVIPGVTLSGLSDLLVLDESLHSMPSGLSYSSLNVIPNSVSESSIRIEGNHRRFNISWDPVDNVNYGQVFYELTVEAQNDKEYMVETGNASWEFDDAPSLTPYSRLRVSLRALTYWGASNPVITTLYSPASVPSQPTNPRIFVSFSNSPLSSQEVQVIFRWDPPVAPNGPLTQYKVTSWLEGVDRIICQHQLEPTIEEVSCHDLPPNSTFFFQVNACTQVGCGVASSAVKGQSGTQRPIPRLLTASSSTISIADLDRRNSTPLVRSTGGSVIDLTYSSLEARVFWIDDSNQILTSRIRSFGKTKIASLNGTGLSIALDWVSRKLYWSEKGDKEGYSTLNYLDLNQIEGGVIKIHTLFEKPALIYSIQIDPVNGLMYWVEQRVNKFTDIIRYHIGFKTSVTFFNQNQVIKKRWGRSACSCPGSPVFGLPLAIDLSSGQTQIYWVDAATNNILVADRHACSCRVVLDASLYPSGGGGGGGGASSLSVDNEQVYFARESEGRVYVIKKSETVRPASWVRWPGIRSVRTLGSHTQPYPRLECLLPGRHSSRNITLVSRTSTSLVLALPSPSNPPDCAPTLTPTTKHTLLFDEIQTDGTTECALSFDKCSRLETFQSEISITDLKPFTNYVFDLIQTNYYSHLAGIVPKLGPPTVFQTAPGAPTVPGNVVGQVVNPSTVEVTWTKSTASLGQPLWYEVRWESVGLVDGGRHKGEQVVPDLIQSPYLPTVSATLLKLHPGLQYSIWVRAYGDEAVWSESERVEVELYPQPEDIKLEAATAYTLNISWTTNPNITSHTLQYLDASGDWRVVAPQPPSRSQYSYWLFGLRPKTAYTFRLRLLYHQSQLPYLWPPDNRFTFRTHGDRPSPPGVPFIKHYRGSTYQVTWEPARENGAPIQMYWLEGRRTPGVAAARRRRSTPSNSSLNNSLSAIHPPFQWTLYYNGTENRWVMSELSVLEKHQLRVRAKNSYGWSDWSGESSQFDLSTASLLAVRQEMTYLIWILTPAAVLLFILIFTFMFYRHEKEKKAQVQAGMNPPRTIRIGDTDVELATLRELPRRLNFVQNTNLLYSGADLVTEVDLTVPHLRREDITLTKFLGSGAFGEVFEGIARTLETADQATLTRVAVKTLKKGATDIEKSEFLKEAQLMSNFKHPHILQLLGVCLDNDPNFIILELMEGGDLLSYLRSSRPVMSIHSSLTLLDLLSMCVDVARGCRYLEEMHFVHRDLACRNCLVSSAEPSARLVKIGDFGLARDIYKNDYYRKEGEGLLPVRWMAPESLVDGVFTSQSDVWAFGVLLWEIMTLGQQPYPARNNLEVLHYVRNGGRLGQPPNTSLELYELMLKCWSFSPEERPSFKYCLETLEELKRYTTDAPLNDIPHRASWEEDSVDSSSLRLSLDPTLPPIPNYLEVLHDEDGGYEVPRSLEPIPITQSVDDSQHNLSSSRPEILDEASKLLPHDDSYTSMSKTPPTD